MPKIRPRPRPKRPDPRSFQERAFERTVPPDDPAFRQAVTTGTPPAPGRDSPRRNVNFNYLETTDDVLRVIDETTVEQPTVALEETAEAAARQSTEATVDRLMRRPPAAGFDSARMLKARQVMVESATRIAELAKDINASGADDETMLTFRQMVAQHRAIQATVQGMTAEAGRVLNQFKIPVSGELRAQAVQGMIDAMGGPDASRQLAKQIANHADDPAAVSRYIEQSWWARSKDALISTYYNFMLSSPLTHARNITGNALVQAFEIPERMLAGAISRIPGIGSQEMYISEGLRQARELNTSIIEGLRVGWKALRTGERMDPMTKIDMRSGEAVRRDPSTWAADVLGMDPNNPMAGALDVLSRMLPSNVLMAEDEAFKGMAFRQHFAALAERQARSEGLKGVQLERRYRELMDDPGEFAEDWYAKAVEYARYQTFTNVADGKLAEMIKAGSRAGGDLGRLIIPFTNTPLNIVKFATERSVLAPLMPQRFLDAVRRGGADRDLALARMMIGWGVTGWVASMVLDGQITGRGPANPTHRAAWRQSGDWREMSIKLGDEWYYFNGTDPLGMMIGSVATTVDYLRYSDDEATTTEAFMGAVLAVAETLTTKQYMSGLAELLDAIEDPESREYFLQRRVGVIVPAGVSHLARWSDDVYRETDGGAMWQTIGNYLKSRIPVASESLPPRVDLWGDIITNPGAYGPDFFSPIYKVSVKGRTGTAELIKNGIALRPPSCTIAQSGGAVSLHQVADERGQGWACYEYRRAVGRRRKERVDALIETGTYRGAADGNGPGTKGELLRQAMADGVDDGKRDMYRRYPILENELALDSLVIDPPRDLPPTLMEF